MNLLKSKNNFSVVVELLKQRRVIFCVVLDVSELKNFFQLLLKHIFYYFSAWNPFL